MIACKCSERLAPLKSAIGAGDNRRPRQWFVLRRNYRCSAFEGYQRHWSPFSDVQCRVCGACWRTQAAYVEHLDDCEHWPATEAPRAEALSP